MKASKFLWNIYIEEAASSLQGCRALPFFKALLPGVTHTQNHCRVRSIESWIHWHSKLCSVHIHTLPYKAKSFHRVLSNVSICDSFRNCRHHKVGFLGNLAFQRFWVSEESKNCLLKHCEWFCNIDMKIKWTKY